MEVSYKKIWKILLDKDTKKERYSRKSKNKLGIGKKMSKWLACKYGCAYEGL